MGTGTYVRSGGDVPIPLASSNPPIVRPKNSKVTTTLTTAADIHHAPPPTSARTYNPAKGSSSSSSSSKAANVDAVEEQGELIGAIGGVEEDVGIKDDDAATGTVVKDGALVRMRERVVKKGRKFRRGFSSKGGEVNEGFVTSSSPPTRTASESTLSEGEGEDRVALVGSKRVKFTKGSKSTTTAAAVDVRRKSRFTFKSFGGGKLPTRTELKTASDLTSAASTSTSATSTPAVLPVSSQEEIVSAKVKSGGLNEAVVEIAKGDDPSTAVEDEPERVAVERQNRARGGKGRRSSTPWPLRFELVKPSPLRRRTRVGSSDVTADRSGAKSEAEVETQSSGAERNESELSGVEASGAVKLEMEQLDKVLAAASTKCGSLPPIPSRERRPLTHVVEAPVPSAEGTSL